ncbi:VOC family protein [Streptomyces sp. NPDC048506]|uniref:VOC family protein n=1 Tax=Streptomyces sp. NPDC048506 TaxID=3155028 RepID=UPI003412E6C9
MAKNTITSEDTVTPADTSDTIPAPQVWPVVRASDAHGLIRFLVEAFGFEETAVYGTAERVEHAELCWPEGGGIMLGSVKEAEEDGDHCPLRPGTFGCYVVTAHPDALCARARAAGAEITEEPNDTDYGSRGFGARDPEGNSWSFGTYRGGPRKV